MIVLLNDKPIDVQFRCLSYEDIAVVADIEAPFVEYINHASGTSGTLETGERLLMTEGLVIRAVCSCGAW